MPLLLVAKRSCAATGNASRGKPLSCSGAKVGAAAISPPKPRRRYLAGFSLRFSKAQKLKFAVPGGSSSGQMRGYHPGREGAIWGSVVPSSNDLSWALARSCAADLKAKARLALEPAGAHGGCRPQRPVRDELGGNLRRGLARAANR
jgi:hypothetical protein